MCGCTLWHPGVPSWGRSGCHLPPPFLILHPPCPGRKPSPCRPALALQGVQKSTPDSQLNKGCAWVFFFWVQIPGFSLRSIQILRIQRQGNVVGLKQSSVSVWNINVSTIWCVIFPVPLEERIQSRSPALLGLCCACSSCSSSHHQQGFHLCLLLEKTQASTKLQQSAPCCGWWQGDGDLPSLCCCRPCWNLCIYFSWIVQDCHHLTVRVVFPGAPELTVGLYLLKDCHHSRENLLCVGTIRAEVKTELKQAEIVGFLSQPFFISFLFLQRWKINKFLPWNSSVW